MTGPDTPEPTHVVIGKVVKAQGLDGKLKVRCYSDTADVFETFTTIFLENRQKLQPYSLRHSRNQGKFAILSLDAVTDRTTAESLVGQEVWVLRTHFPSLGPDEFYWHELVGLTVITDQGIVLGKVTSMIATGSHDIMVITGNHHDEYLVPVVKEMVAQQDAESGVLVITPPPGLLEINSPDAV